MVQRNSLASGALSKMILKVNKCQLLKMLQKMAFFIEGRGSEQKVIWKIIIIAISNKIHYGFFHMIQQKMLFTLKLQSIMFPFVFNWSYALFASVQFALFNVSRLKNSIITFLVPQALWFAKPPVLFSTFPF